MHTQWLLFLVSAAADLRVGQINLRYSFTISRVLHLVVVSIFLRCWCGFGIMGLLANLVASQFGECGVHLVGQGLVPVLVDAQLVCINYSCNLVWLDLNLFLQCTGVGNWSCGCGHIQAGLNRLFTVYR